MTRREGRRRRKQTNHQPHHMHRDDYNKDNVVDVWVPVTEVCWLTKEAADMQPQAFSSHHANHLLLLARCSLEWWSGGGLPPYTEKQGTKYPPSRVRAAIVVSFIVYI